MFYAICYVCAVFHNRKGEPVFRVTRDMLGCLIEMPEAVREDGLFRMLTEDGSLKIPESAGEKKRLENDPMTGISAEGKAVSAAAEKDEKKPAGKK